MGRADEDRLASRDVHPRGAGGSHGIADVVAMASMDGCDRAASRARDRCHSATNALVSALLRNEGFAVDQLDGGAGAVASTAATAPELIVLELDLPGLDGLEVCRRVRPISDAYIVVLSSRAGETDKVAAFEAGADDYVVKPFLVPELVARVRAMRRRPRISMVRPSADVRTFDGLRIDLHARAVSVDGAPVRLTSIEFELLAALSIAPGVVFTRSFLIERVWGRSVRSDDHRVDVHIASLRRKLGDDAMRPRFIVAVRGVGYRMAADCSE
jgi:two-component system alkaline phosphatase synthesis response regulator PhoP